MNTLHDFRISDPQVRFLGGEVAVLAYSPFRWLTVVSPEELDGTELQSALDNNPATKAYQQTIFQQSQPAAMFYTDDVKGEYERIKTRGAEFTMPPTEVTASTTAMLNDTCGNLIQLTQPARHYGRRRRFRFVRVYPGNVRRAAKGGRQRSLHR